MKKRFTKLIAIVIAALMLLSTLACSAVEDDPVIGKVGKVKLYYSMYLNRYQNYYMYVSQGYGAYVADLIISELTSYGVALNMCYELGLDKLTDEQKAEVDKLVDEALDKELENITLDDDSVTDEAAIRELKLAKFKDNLKNSGTTYKSYMKSLRQNVLESYLLDRLKEYSDNQLEISDQDIIDYINEQTKTDTTTYSEDGKMEDYFTAYSDYLNDNGILPLYNPEGLFTVKHLLVKYSNTAEGAEVPEGGRQGVNGVFNKDGVEKIDRVVEYLKSEDAILEGFLALIEEIGEDTGMTTDKIREHGYIMNDQLLDKYASGFGYAGMTLYAGHDWEPTPEPTATPTPDPTIPDAEATSNPDASAAAPTAESTAIPTAVPTAAPSAAPTTEPTPEPTATPTPEVEYYSVKVSEDSDESIEIAAVETTLGIHYIFISDMLTPGAVTVNYEDPEDALWKEIKEFRINELQDKHYSENLSAWEETTKIKFNKRYIEELESIYGLKSSSN